MNSIECGYACIHVGLSESKPKVTTNRRMRRDAWLASPLEAAKRSLLNVQDLIAIIDQTGVEKIRLFRFSSELLVGGTDLVGMPRRKLAAEKRIYSQIEQRLDDAGRAARSWGIRVTTHPGPFEMLASPREDVQQQTRASLGWHAWVMDCMGLPWSPYAKINVHLGGTYNDKAASLNRAIANFWKLPEAVRWRLTVENDDRLNGWHVEDLLTFYEATGCPVVFDYHHFALANPRRMPLREAVDACADTWTHDVPCFHMSSPREPGSRAHADFVTDRIETFGRTVDVVLEAKAKNLAVHDYYARFPDQRPARFT